MTEDFPCSARSSSYTHATANTPARLPGACFAHFPGSGSLPRIDWQVGPCITVFEACSAFTHVAACVLAKSPSDPLHRRLQPFRYLHDCSDCYRPERKRPGGFRTRWKSADFARRTSNSGAREQWRVVADQLRERFPKIGALMDEAEPDVLAHMSFPREHHSKIYSTNPIERLNGEIKRRTDVVGIFPNEDAIVRLVGALLLEQNDEWALCRRYMSLETLAELGHNPSVSLPAVAD